MISNQLGIKMPPSKQVMLQSRLHHRVRQLGMNSVRDYHEYFFANEETQAQELQHLIDLATTNKTDFFREPDHFEFLSRHVCSEWLSQGASEPFRVWCAGCSSGEEPYTLAMTLLERSDRQRFSFSIHATDISRRMLDRAIDAVYSIEQVEPIPPAIRPKYLLRGRDHNKGLVRIAPEVRECISFAQLNFLWERYPLPHLMDVIFFRNVMIYFERDTQRLVVERMLRHLRPGGYLFIAHAETLQGYGLPVQLVAPSVYRHERRG